MAYGKKAFSWSYSKLKNYENCPKKHYEIDVAKNYTESTAALDEGNRVHRSFAGAILKARGLPAVGAGNDRVEPGPLADDLKEFDYLIKQVVDGPGEVLVEQQLAITEQFQPCEWFARNTWTRAKVDAIRLDGPVGFLWDWKTGKMKHDSIQLFLAAQAVFAHHPQVKLLKTRFVWLTECTPDQPDEGFTDDLWHRRDMAAEWPAVLERVARIKEAARTLTYEPKPGGLCRAYCPVLSCPYHGKGARG